MSEKAQINVKVEPETKAEWRGYAADSPSVNSLSDLIRLAVTKEITGVNSKQDTDREHLEEINSNLTEIQQQIGELDNRVSRVETATQDNPEIDELANEIFPLLPDIEPGTNEWKDRKQKLEQQAKEGVSESQTEYKAWDGTAKGLSEALDTDEWQIRKALDKLISDMKRVRVTEYADKERYWRDI